MFCFFKRPHFTLGLAMLILLSTEARSQCDPPDQLPSPFCETAPLICLLDACYQTLQIPGNGPSSWCNGNNTIENPQFFMIIPTSSCGVIQIHVDSCTSGTSLQAAILNDCPWGIEDVLSCNGGTSPGGDIILSTCNMIPFEPHWLMFDGSSGAICYYTITYTEGFVATTFNEELESLEATPTSVCAGYDGLTLTAEPPIPLAPGYYWVIGWSGDTVTSTLNTITINIPPNLDPDTYEFCVRAFSGCDTTDNELCVEVEVYQIPPEEKEPIILCPETFPIDWGALTISGPGDFEQTFTSPEGCIYDSTWVVEAYPEPEMGYVDTLYCLPPGEFSFYYEGEAYDQSDLYPLFYDNADINGCDSMAEINVQLIGVDAFVELGCDEGEFELMVLFEEIIPFSADIDFYWYKDNTIIWDENPLRTSQTGCYDLWVRLYHEDVSCDFFVETICIDGNDFLPPPPDIPTGDMIICSTAVSNFCITVDPAGEPNLAYNWTAPAGVNITGNGSECVSMDFSNGSSGQVCVNAISECGAGLPTCFNINIQPPPTATFSIDPEVCIGEHATIVYTGSSTSSAQFIWDFDSPASVTGSGSGPYSISWSNPGSKTIQLMVIEPDCDTVNYASGIDVDFFPAPVINCSSTINSIDFSWNDIPGANGYLVSFDGQPAVSISGTDTSLIMLTPGTVIELELTAVSSGPCASTIDTLVCAAVNCPPPTIQLIGVDSACLNAPTIIDLDAIVNGNTGVGIWSGPGIIEPTEGLFDPVLAGSGSQQVVFTADINGCPFSETFSIFVKDSVTADFDLETETCVTRHTPLIYTGNASGTASYIFDFDGANVIGSGNGPYQLRWSSPGLKTVTLQVIEDGCISTIVSKDIEVQRMLESPEMNCRTTDSTIVFSWILDPMGFEEDVNPLTGQPYISINDSVIFTTLNAGEVVTIAFTTFSDGPCPNRIDTFTCVAKSCPPVELVISPVQGICLYPNSTSIDLDITITNGNGIGDWSGSGVIDVVDGIFDPAIAGVGVHQVVYHYFEDDCDFFEYLTIDVFDVPGAVISNTDLVITCATGSISLDGAASLGGPLNYQWTTSQGSLAGSDTTAIAEATQPGFYQLLVTNAISGCMDSVAVTLTQSSDIPIADAGPDKALTCDSLQLTLGGQSSVGNHITYTWTSLIGNIVSPFNGIRIEANQVGEYGIVVRDTVTGCQSQDNAIISIDTSVADIELIPGDTIDCNTQLSSAFSILDEPVEDYAFSWTTTDGLIVGSTSGLEIEVSQGGTYALTIQNLRNGCAKTAQLFIPESDEIIDGIQVVIIDVSCFGDTDGIISIQSVDGGVPDYYYSWSVGVVDESQLTSLAPGAYAVTVTDANGCSFSQIFDIGEPEVVMVELGPDQTVTLGDTVHVHAATNVAPGAIASLEWDEYLGNGCSGCYTFQFVAQSSATISVIITDTAGCSAGDAVQLTVIVPRIYFIPTIFSPNRDGINDYFTITGKSNLVMIRSLMIFDRWGNHIFERFNFLPGIPALGWDGTFHNEIAQSGVYTFIAELEFEDITEPVTGNITLLR